MNFYDQSISYVDLGTKPYLIHSNSLELSLEKIIMTHYFSTFSRKQNDIFGAKNVPVQTQDLSTWEIIPS